MGIEQFALLIHIGTIISLVTVVLYTDHLGLRWVLGHIETISAKKLQTLHRLVWSGLFIMVASGFTMFLSYKDFLLYTPVFFIKVFFVAMLVINAFAIGKFMHVATSKPFAILSREEKLPLFVSGAVSTLGWVGAVTCGLILSSLI